MNPSHDFAGALVVAPLADDVVAWIHDQYRYQYVAKWLEYLSPNTAYVYARRIDRWLEWCLVLELDPLQADLATIELYLEWYSETKASSNLVRRGIKGALSNWYK